MAHLSRRAKQRLLVNPTVSITDVARRAQRTGPQVAETDAGAVGADEALADHVIRYLPRDYPLFARMNPGDQYPQAYQHAMEMFEQHLVVLAKQGVKVKTGSQQYEEIKTSIVPPYDVGKFPNKWRKMWRDQPARTLMAHLGKDSYRFNF